MTLDLRITLSELAELCNAVDRDLRSVADEDGYGDLEEGGREATRALHRRLNELFRRALPDGAGLRLVVDNTDPGQ